MRYPIRRGTYRNPPPSPKKSYSTIRIILMILLVTNLVSFMVWQNIKGLELDETINRLEDKQLELHLRLNQQRIDYERLRTDPTIEKIAKERLGMVLTNRNDFIQLGIRDKFKLTEKFLGSKKLDD